jgi:hypothetical protein
VRLDSIGAHESSNYTPISWSLTGASREGCLVRAVRLGARNCKDDSAAFLRLASIGTSCRFKHVRLRGKL